MWNSDCNNKKYKKTFGLIKYAGLVENTFLPLQVIHLDQILMASHSDWQVEKLANQFKYFIDDWENKYCIAIRFSFWSAIN